jgi:hypothetical protein
MAVSPKPLGTESMFSSPLPRPIVVSQILVHCIRVGQSLLHFAKTPVEIHSVSMFSHTRLAP